MTPLRAWFLVLCLLALGVPWWADLLPAHSRLGGLPLWAVVVVLLALLFSGVTWWLIGRHWETLAGEDDDGG